MAEIRMIDEVMGSKCGRINRLTVNRLIKDIAEQKIGEFLNNAALPASVKLFKEEFGVKDESKSMIEVLEAYISSVKVPTYDALFCLSNIYVNLSMKYSDDKALNSVKEYMNMSVTDVFKGLSATRNFSRKKSKADFMNMYECWIQPDISEKDSTNIETNVFTLVCRYRDMVTIAIDDTPIMPPWSEMVWLDNKNDDIRFAPDKYDEEISKAATALWLLLIHIPIIEYDMIKA